MSRFFIVGTSGTTIVRAPSLADSRTDDRATDPCGCTWLFRAESRVDDVEAALRAAIFDFFASAAGERLREREELETLGWEDALPWIPDEVWQQHGLTAIRHPDVERILLDRNEDLCEGWASATAVP